MGSKLRIIKKEVRRIFYNHRHSMDSVAGNLQHDGSVKAQRGKVYDSKTGGSGEKLIGCRMLSW